ncbi:hypothetical protein H6B15_03835 [Gemmiger formicilis]|uniref:P-loop NTPase n=1 Tax=Gemmiger formicilis TaxID=745368 RepID=UPI00195E1BED|nr:hypothetical protein [Gemmiger formicilis]MBM6715791.1 hypothetical protein [Gemmiger formicilis]
MLKFCDEIEKNATLKKEYHQHVQNIARWYQHSFEHYSALLKTELELGIKTIEEELSQTSDASKTYFDIAQDFQNNLDFANSAKAPYFVMSDALVKLILSMYSIGPNTPDGFLLSRHGISYNTSGNGNKTWIDCTADVWKMTEIITKVLRDEVGTFSIDFYALLFERSARSKLVHAARGTLCLSALRCYNVIREMLIFLDSDYCDTLPTFDLNITSSIEGFCYDKFLMPPCSFSFNDTTSILITDSVHDIRRDYREAVANLPWNLVIDFDGYSDCGGLLSTVNHNRILKEVLYRDIANNLDGLPVDQTLWYRCGEYQNYNFVPSPKGPSIPSYISFLKGLPGTSSKIQCYNWMKEVFIQLFLEAKKRERMIHVVVLTDNYSLTKCIIEAFTSETLKTKDYFITWVGLSNTNKEKILESEYLDDGDDMQKHFCYQLSPISLFYKAFYENKNYWHPRESLDTTFSLPGFNGPISLSENERNNLAADFFALYDNCEQEGSDHSEELRQKFYSGATASWNTIANQTIPCLRKSVDFDKMKQKMRSLLGQTQEIPQKRLFFINHTAGIGGTTLARQLVWDLHTDYAVLEVRTYNQKSFKSQIEHLYDVVLQKSPIILLADDTLPYFSNLCEAVCRLERRCVLVAACRSDNSILRNYPQANCEFFASIPDKDIQVLKERYRSVSSLPEDILRAKDGNFDRDIHGKMRTPFIIGLYYKEKDFSIDEYVYKALNGCTERRYADVLAFIAICDRYGYKNVPFTLVRKLLNLDIRQDFLTLVPAASSLITTDLQISGAVCYRFMHHLLSQRYFELYCEKYYKSHDNIPNALYDLSYSLIDHIADMGQQLSENLMDLLISILIQNKAPSSTAQDQYLSALMIEINVPENQRMLMQHLAEKFEPFAIRFFKEQTDNPSRPDRVQQLTQRLVSHSYAHLGRMYSRGAHNHAKAYECFCNAIAYMPDEDPNIYHMAGCSLLDKLNEQFHIEENNWDTSARNAIQTDVKDACGYFDDTIRFGSPDYGYPSKLELLFKYLEFLYRIRGIRSAEDLSKMDPTTREFQSEFISAAQEAASYTDLGDIADAKIRDYKSRFQSQILFGSYQQAVEYYQSKVDSLRATEDIVGYGIALRNLIFTLIDQARSKSPSTPFYRNLKNAQKILEDITILLQKPYDINNYADYRLRSQMFHYWMLLSKHLNVPIERGLVTSASWVEMEDQFRSNRNPEPYYYRRVLLLLSIKSGNLSSRDELKRLIQRITQYDAAGDFDRRRCNIERTRDLLVDKTEMGQLFDVTACRTEEEMVADMDLQNARPVIVHAHFSNCLNQSNANFEIYDPQVWSSEPVRMRIGRNSSSSLSTNQLGHKVAFIMGFSVTTTVALSYGSADLSSGESLNVQEVLQRARAEVYPKISFASTSTNTKEVSSPRIESLPRGAAACFKDGEKSSNGKWINGTVNGSRAGVSVDNDLMRFPKDEIRYYGGIEEVVRQLCQKPKLPCVILNSSCNTTSVEYQVSFFSASKSGTLAELLEGSSHSAEEHNPPKLQSAELTTDTAPVIANGSIVEVKLKSVNTDSASGVFIRGEECYPIVIKSINKQKRKKLIQEKDSNLIKVRVISYNGESYVGKLTF